jgi:tetratricopeptide (TPR) repeat protein
VNGLEILGRNDEARAIGADALDVGNKLLKLRPGYRLALHGVQLIESDLAGIAQNDFKPDEALGYAEQALQTSQTLYGLDPSNTVTINNMGNAYQQVGDIYWTKGRLSEAFPFYAKAVDAFAKATSGGSSFFILHGYTVAQTSARQAIYGDAAGAAATLADGEKYLSLLRQREPSGSVAVAIVDATQKLPNAELAFERDDLATAHRLTEETIQELAATPAHGGIQESQKHLVEYISSYILGHIAYLEGDFAAAERAERAAIKARNYSAGGAVGDLRDLGECSSWLAMSLARQGRRAEALQVIAPIVKLQRDLAAKNHGDRWLPVELASALYAQALAEEHGQAALLREAAASIDGVLPSIRSLHDVKKMRGLIDVAMRGAG